MKAEPKRRRDGYCVVCQKKKAILDAFCSTGCCRQYFGTTEIVVTSTLPKPS
jgi:hypothetical protein